jgi:hypothetical protein
MRNVRRLRRKLHSAHPANPGGKSVAAIPPGPSCDGCPYQRRNPSKPDTEDGFCTLLDLADWRTGGLLWDGIKECGFNEEPEGEPKRRPRFGERRRWEAVLARPSILTWTRWPRPSPRAVGWRTQTFEAGLWS